MKTLLATAALLAATQAPALTVLNFQGDICAGNAEGGGALLAGSNGLRINQAYGDGGGVDVSYLDQTGSTNSMAFWSGDYSGLSAVAYGGVDPSITLLGALTLHSFDLGAWPNLNRDTQVTVIDLATMTNVLSTGTITVLGSTPSHFDINVSSAVGFRIVFGPDGYNVAIDNIAFTAGVVPEPSQWALLAAGLGWVGALARRRRPR